jgi:sugar lactone lactonase YvrE
MLVCDAKNRRVIRWPRHAQQGEILIDKVYCSGLAFDNQGFLYVTEHDKHRVSKWKTEKHNATGGQIVAGGNGKGTQLGQLNEPSSVFVDRNGTVYVADFSNDRIVKWTEGAEEGILVGKLRWPRSVLVDQSGTIYSIDGYHAQVMRFTPNNTEGTVIIVGRQAGSTQSSILSQPYDLSFDQHGNLYVVNFGNGRVDKFGIDRSACV